MIKNNFRYFLKFGLLRSFSLLIYFNLFSIKILFTCSLSSCGLLFPSLSDSSSRKQVSTSWRKGWWPPDNLAFAPLDQLAVSRTLPDTCRILVWRNFKLLMRCGIIQTGPNRLFRGGDLALSIFRRFASGSSPSSLDLSSSCLWFL